MSDATTGTTGVKRGMAEMLKGGVIMDVVTPDQAKIAEDAGAVAVMALERVPADIRRDGGVARMSDPEKIREIQEAVSIPVMAKARIGHFVVALVLFGAPLVTMTVLLQFRPELIHALMDPRMVAAMERMYDPSNPRIGKILHGNPVIFSKIKLQF